MCQTELIDRIMIYQKITVDELTNFLAYSGAESD